MNPKLPSEAEIVAISEKAAAAAGYYQMPREHAEGVARMITAYLKAEREANWTPIAEMVNLK